MYIDRVLLHAFALHSTVGRASANLQNTATHCNNTLQQHTATTHCNNTLHHTATSPAYYRWHSLRGKSRSKTNAATRCNTLQHTVTRCNTHTVTHCNTLQLTATLCGSRVCCCYSVCGHTLQHAETH